MQFKIKLDYKFKVEIKEKPQETSQNLLSLAVHAKYPQGIDGAYRRTYNRIVNKIDTAIDTDAEFIELEKSEYYLIKNVIGEAKVPVQFVQKYGILEESFESIKKEENN